jgi:hypothetical protein
MDLPENKNANNQRPELSLNGTGNSTVGKDFFIQALTISPAKCGDAIKSNYEKFSVTVFIYTFVIMFPVLCND